MSKFGPQLHCIKEVGTLGRLGIPEELREQLDMRPGSRVQLLVHGRDLIVRSISTGTPAKLCCSCGASDPAIHLSNDKHMCSSCAHATALALSSLK